MEVEDTATGILPVAGSNGHGQDDTPQEAKGPTGEGMEGVAQAEGSAEGVGQTDSDLQQLVSLLFSGSGDAMDTDQNGDAESGHEEPSSSQQSSSSGSVEGGEPKAEAPASEPVAAGTPTVDAQPGEVGQSSSAEADLARMLGFLNGSPEQAMDGSTSTDAAHANGQAEAYRPASASPAPSAVAHTPSAHDATASPAAHAPAPLSSPPHDAAHAALAALAAVAGLSSPVHHEGDAAALTTDESASLDAAAATLASPSAAAALSLSASPAGVDGQQGSAGASPTPGAPTTAASPSVVLLSASPVGGDRQHTPAVSEQHATPAAGSPVGPPLPPPAVSSVSSPTGMAASNNNNSNSTGEEGVSSPARTASVSPMGAAGAVADASRISTPSLRATPAPIAAPASSPPPATAAAALELGEVKREEGPRVAPAADAAVDPAASHLKEEEGDEEDTAGASDQAEGEGEGEEGEKDAQSKPPAVKVGPLSVRQLVTVCFLGGSTHMRRAVFALSGFAACLHGMFSVCQAKAKDAFSTPVGCRLHRISRQHPCFVFPLVAQLWLLSHRMLLLPNFCAQAINSMVQRGLDKTRKAQFNVLLRLLRERMVVEVDGVCSSFLLPLPQRCALCLAAIVLPEGACIVGIWGRYHANGGWVSAHHACLFASRGG